MTAMSDDGEEPKKRVRHGCGIEITKDVIHVVVDGPTIVCKDGILYASEDEGE